MHTSISLSKVVISQKNKSPFRGFCRMRALVDDVRTVFGLENNTAIYIPSLTYVSS
jgi:hypothetical protein